MRRLAGVLLATGVGLAAASGCSGDDAASDKKAFCDRVNDIALTSPDVLQSQGRGTQLRRLRAVAPESIADDLDVLVAAAADDTATSEDDVAAATDNVQTYITDEC